MCLYILELRRHFKKERKTWKVILCQTRKLMQFYSTDEGKWDYFDETVNSIIENIQWKKHLLKYSLAMLNFG